ncbi:unnamed protein product [Rotaria socialis]|uniref:Uncharacterized protein n=2 Tax=Rotaria socialis TaxID=392032 RepID=A0A818VPG5_9BILA|nr:unnamed protein product [Rotaria socialis]CAF3756910.1 unnamed protein product [Rotaria socialis]
MILMSYHTQELGSQRDTELAESRRKETSSRKRIMNHLLICISVLCVILMHFHINGYDQLYIPERFIRESWLKEIKVPPEQSDQSDVSSTADKKSTDEDRRRRNCLTYAVKNVHRSHKWMCW